MTWSTNDEWPDVISVPESFKTVDKVAERTEFLRTTLIQRNEENSKLQWSLFKYKLGFWCLVALGIGSVGALIIGVLWG